jgi:hypothetical protein
MFDKKAYNKEYRKSHLEQVRKNAREWARRNPVPYKWSESKRTTQQRYRLKHKDKIAVVRRAYFHRKLETDIQYKLMWLLRARVMIAIKQQLGNKAYKTIELLGCSPQEAREHIEKQFTEGMSWETHGKFWEIDHIKCVATFDLTKPEEQKKCFHYTNLQPLIFIENRRKQPKRLNRMKI